MRVISEIIVHCTASDYPCDDSVEAIRELHTAPIGAVFPWGGELITKTEQFNDIGYHIIITKDGIEFGRPIEKPGAHCRGHNAYSVGVVLTGLTHFSEKQKKWLKDVLSFLMTSLLIEKCRIYPHRQFNENKTCPNFDLEEISKEL